MIDPKVILQLFGTLATVVGIPKLYLDSSLALRSRLREEYKFAKEYLTDLDCEGGLHPYLREKGSEAITGRRDANPEHVEYLLALLKPSEALQLYAVSKEYLETEYTNGNRYLQNPNRSGVVRLVFKKKYRKRWKRSVIKWGFFVLYCIPASSLMWTPELIRLMVHDLNGQLAFAGVWFVTAFLLGWFFISRARRVSWAALLIKKIAEDREIKEHIRLREKAE
ncbi:hypothetical protein PTKU64_84900 [Paraburkholderia terrae]|uniref:Uncharacterized protein n=1 Tax=Paraburkholderia terrae TaxID=311230 RepID=A0ABN6JV17_9BURK|nr:hypothetical protein [Paraburkholderia terrae]BCZ84815.1 hypothetical protein PTKU64_84900 [Paraburkholderia terrae]